MRLGYQCKRFVKNTVAIIICTVFAAIPLTLDYLLWSWLMGQLDTGLAKAVVTLGLIFVLGGVTIWATILFAGVALSAAAEVID